jgi:hypothetical protein
VLALGAGSALAVTHSIHHKKKHHKPSGKSVTTGPAGPSGATGATGPAGATGATGATGGVGPQGPGADTFVGTVTAGSTSTNFPSSGGVGPVPVYVQCINEGTGNAPYTELETTATSGGIFPDDFGGTMAATYTYGVTGLTSSPQTYQYTRALPLPGDIAGLFSDSDAVVGTVIFDYYQGGFLDDTTTTETVTFELTESGTGSTATCSVVGQVVFGSSTSRFVI